MNITKPYGSLAVKKISIPTVNAAWRLKNILRPAYIMGWFASFVIAPVLRKFGVGVLLGKLEATKTDKHGNKVNYGVLGYRVVTTAFAAFVVDQLQTETSVFGDFKYHDSGVGTTAENVTDTAIETTDGESRATGTQTEGTSVQYVSVGTIAYTTSKAITEHGLFNDATTGTLMDRTVFSAVNVVNGESIQFTYTLTVTAGG